MEELLCLLDPAYFRRLFKLQLKASKRKAQEFRADFANFGIAFESSLKLVIEAFRSESELKRDEMFETMEYLKLYHPAVWYRVYKSVSILNEKWADELVGDDSDEPFLSL